MSHLKPVSRSPQVAAEVEETVVVITKLTSAFVTIYSTIWLSKNWQDIVDTANE